MKFTFPSSPTITSNFNPSDDDHISYSYLAMLAEAAAAILHGGFTHYYEPFMIFFLRSFRFVCSSLVILACLCWLLYYFFLKVSACTPLLRFKPQQLDGGWLAGVENCY